MLQPFLTPPLFMSEIREQLSSIWIEIKETLHLNLDYAKLTATEKITVLLSTIAIVLICFAVEIGRASCRERV